MKITRISNVQKDSSFLPQTSGVIKKVYFEYKTVILLFSVVTDKGKFTEIPSRCFP